MNSSLASDGTPFGLRREAITADCLALIDSQANKERLQMRQFNRAAFPNEYREESYSWASILTEAFLLVMFSLRGIGCADESSHGTDTLPVIAKSGIAQVQRIRIIRQVASRQAKSADLSNMEICLWFATPGELDIEDQSEPLVRFTDLQPIVDNTGKLLTTELRLKAIPYLKADCAGVILQGGGKVGPEIGLVLDVLAREATQIVSIKGKVILSEAKVHVIDYKNLTELNKTVLEDPELKDLKIEATVEVDNATTQVRLVKVSGKHQQLESWELRKGNQSMSPKAELELNDKSEKRYKGDQTKSAYLRIRVVEPINPRAFDFDFKNIPLP